jgi:RNA polymerase sigma-70 factor (ECF subfamily)
MTTDDTQLIRQAQEGSVTAFEQLVFRHDKQVLALAARYTSSSADAKDIYQETFLRAYRGIHGFRFQSDFATWIHRITVNVCLSHQGRARRGSHVPLQDDVNEDDGETHGAAILADGRPSPEEAAVHAQTAERIEEALGALSPRQRMAMTLRFYEDQSLAAIAEAMQCSVGAVKRYLFDGTRRMRVRLQDLI